MGLPSPLIPALVCLLAWGSGFAHSHRHSIPLEETIKMLNILLARKDPRCMELMVADVLAAPESVPEAEALCRAATALRQVYRRHKCPARALLSGLDRNLSSMAGKTTCPVNEAKKRALRDFLERLKRIMQEKFSRG